MQFFYSQDAKEDIVTLQNDSFKHLKAQRKKIGEIINLRNLEDSFLYSYKITSINRNKAYLELKSKEKSINLGGRLHLGWCIIDPKSIEKTLPFLNEIGVKKISFIYSDFSQKNFKLDLPRMKRILIVSCEQCGRSDFIEFEILNSVSEYINLYPQSHILDFGGKQISDSNSIDSVLVGCEGGFSQKERKLFKNVISFQSNLILRSESAVVSIASKVLL